MYELPRKLDLPPLTHFVLVFKDPQGELLFNLKYLYFKISKCVEEVQEKKHFFKERFSCF